MKQWYRLLAVSVLGLVVASCTGSDQQQADGQRGIASYSGKVRLKKVNIERRGFYISHKSLQPLSVRDQEAYYGIFANAVKDLEYVMRKNKKYSMNKNLLERLKQMFVPTADAVPCPTSGWVLENGKSTCDASNWTFRPESVSSFNKYKPAASLYDSSQKFCGENGGRMVCPAVGLVVRSGKAMLACSSNSRGISTSCTNQFANGGIRTTVRLLNECQNPGTARSVSNVSCDDLKSSVRKSIQMFNDNCSPSAIRKSSAIGKVCEKLETAVNGVASKIGEAVNPIASVEMPDTPTCNKLAGRVEDKHSPMMASTAWNGLLDAARQNCPDLKGKDRNSAASIFGKCTAELSTPEDIDTNELISQLGSAKKRAEYGYVKRFSRAYGLTPASYLKLFCGAGDITTFTRRITKDLEDHMNKSEKDLIGILRFQDLKGASWGTGDEKKFMDIKQWLLDNNKAMENLAKSNGGSQFAKQAKDIVTASDRRGAQNAVNMGMQMAGKKSDFSLEEFFSDRVLKGKNALVQLKMRAALAEELKNKVMSPNHQRQIKAAQGFMNECAAQIRKDGEAKPVAGGTFIPDEVNFKGCRYVRENDVTGYFENEYDKPYVIFKKGSPGTCYEQTVEHTPEIVSKNGNLTTIRRISAANPLSPSDIIDRITVNNSEFNVGTSATSDNPYSLFRYVCTKDIADAESSFDGSDVWSTD